MLSIIDTYLYAPYIAAVAGIGLFIAITKPKPELSHFSNIYIIHSIAAIHFVWGLILLFAGSQYTASLSGLIDLDIPVALLGIIMMAVAILAEIGVTVRPGSSTLVLLLPQQIVMLISSIAVIQLIVDQKFADGVARSWQFILADQLWIIVLTIAHTIIIAKAVIKVNREIGGDDDG